MFKFQITLILLTIFACNEEKSNKSSTYANEPIVIEKENGIDFSFEVEGDKMTASLILSENSTKNETIIWVPKTGGYSDKLNIINDLNQNGKNVILLHHRGFKESEGLYSYSNCLKDVEALVKHITTKTNSTNLKINPKKIVLIGLAYGAGIALIKGSELASVSKIIGINTLNYGQNMESYESIEELDPLIKFMKKKKHLNLNSEDFVKEIFLNKKIYNISNYQEKLSKKNILLIEWTNTNQHLINGLETAKSINLKSDKDYIKNRPKLVNTILEWLDKN